jgi:dTDP-4-dehydrorhamnose 3,5-epimerase
MNKVDINKIEGIKIYDIPSFSDERGTFFESFRKNNYNKVFKQDSVSFSKKNVLRGLHYQKKKTQAHLVTIIKGCIFDVTVDLRRRSKTFGKFASITLSHDGIRQVFLPIGCAHGFQVTSKEAIIHYKLTDYYSKGDEGGIRWNDPYLDIDWPNKKPIISSKDENLKFFNDIENKETLF